MLYLLVSVILLINLLIASMSARFDAKKLDAARDSRVAFGRLVLRFERLYDTIPRVLMVLCCGLGGRSETAKNAIKFIESRTQLGEEDSAMDKR